MAWRSFFRTIDERDLDTPEKLTALLLAMARKKAIQERRHSTAQMRDGRREVSLTRLPGGGSELPDPKPSSTDMAIWQEQWEQVLKKHPEQHRQVVKLRSAGHRCKEIGEIMGLDEGSVRRILRKLFEEFRG
jgi:RNA polymerase sigma factor (sigma-70 family)